VTTQKLLNPGPVTLTDRVRRALLREDACHREADFAVFARDVRARLARVYPEAEASHVPVLLTASGTGAVEAMVGSLVPRGGKALVVANGVYGERAAEMLAAQGKAFEVVRSAWTAPMDVAGASQRLDEGAFTHVVAVHHETTTGRLNDVGALGAVCRVRGVPLLLDAVSSFGGEEIRFDAWNVVACAATANKCLHAVPGLAFVLVRKGAFEAASGATSVYLDLHRYAAEQAGGAFPFTPAVQALFALDEALRELGDEGGVPARRARYASLSGRLRCGLGELGIEMLLDAAECSSMLTSFHVPSGVSYEVLHDGLKAAGFVLYAGQGQLQGAVFRVAVMGDLTAADIDGVVAEIGGLLTAAAPPRRSRPAAPP
jgi:2-aminoethylphosphonate-pyruvate transaminase